MTHIEAKYINVDLRYDIYNFLAKLQTYSDTVSLYPDIFDWSRAILEIKKVSL